MTITVRGKYFLEQYEPVGILIYTVKKFTVMKKNYFKHVVEFQISNG